MDERARRGRRSGGGRRRAFDAPRVGRWLLAVVVVASGLLLGSLYTTTLAPLTVLASLSAVLVWRGGEPGRLRSPAVVLLAVAAGLTAYTAFQALPLPFSVVRALSPAAADAVARAYGPLGEAPPAFTTLSLEPLATRVEALRGLFYLSLLAAALGVAARGDDEEALAGRVFLERVVLVAVSAMALAALVHPAVQAQRVFGAYVPREFAAEPGARISPLLNYNHLAAYLNVGALLAVAAAISPQQTLPRALALVAAPLFAAVSLGAGSRGGTGSLVLGIGLIVGLTLTRGRARASSVTGGVVVVVVVVAAAGMVGLAASESARADLGDRDLSKLSMILRAFALVRAFPVFGVGRGAFEAVFPSVARAPDYVLYTNPENVVAQWVTEWGPAVALAAFAALAWALRPRVALGRRGAAVGAFAALGSAFVHNLVDFSSEVPGVVACFVLLGALVTGGAARSEREPAVVALLRRVGVRVGRAARTGAVPVAIVVGVAAVMSAPHELKEEKRSAERELVDQAPSADAVLASAVRRHPAEPYFPYLLAVRAFQRREPAFVAWAARTLERSPVHGRVHLLLGRGLAARYPAQARFELRRSLEQDSGMVDEVIRHGPALVVDEESALELVPEGASRAAVLEGLSRAVGARLPSTAARLDALLLRASPPPPPALLRRARAALADARTNEPWCIRRACVDDGLELARRHRVLEPGDCEGAHTLAELLVLAGDVDGALAEVERAMLAGADRGTCLRVMIDVASAVDRPRRVEAALEALVRQGCLKVSDCVDNALFASTYLETIGRRERALAFCKRALESAPGDEQLLRRIGALAEVVGLYGEAYDAYAKLARRFPEDATVVEGAARARRALGAAMPGRSLPATDP